MNRTAFLVGAFFLLVSCTALGPDAGNTDPPDATIRTSTRTILAQDYGSHLLQFDAADKTYLNPYHRLGIDRNAVPYKQKTFEAVILENDYVRIEVLPELGGRITRFVNKSTGNNQFFENPAGIKINPWGRHGWWIATGGNEVMFPFDEHAGSFYLPWDHYSDDDPGWVTLDGEDGVTLFMAFDESVEFGLERFRVELEIFLPNDSALFEVTTTAENLSASTQPLQLWNNSMIAPGEGNMVVGSPGYSRVNHELIFGPNITQVYNHNDNLGESFWGDPWDTVSWPVHTGPLHGGGNQSIDVSRIRNWYSHDLKFAGLFTVSGQVSTFAGQYNLTDDEGFAKTFPETIDGVQTGVKYWHWGSFSATASHDFADGTATYAEIMTGPVRVFQEPASAPPTTHPLGEGEPYSIDMTAGEVISWTERYFTPHGIGSFVEANDDVILNLSVNANASNADLTVGIYPTRTKNGGTLTIRHNGALIAEQSLGAVGPGTEPAPYFEVLTTEQLDSGSVGVLTLKVEFSDGTEGSASISL